MDLQTSAIYVDLDSLFDTRLAVLHNLGIKGLDRVITSQYYDRTYDEFEGIETEIFKEAYEKRNLDTLVNALITPVARHLYQFGRQTLIALVASPYRRQPKVVVNIHPYVLSPESEHFIINGVRAVTKNIMDVELISVPLESLTPSYVKQNYVQMVMYAYWEWLECHAANGLLAETQCPEVTLIGPQLVKSKKAALELKGVDVFATIESYTSLFIKLTLSPVSLFCVDLDRLKFMKISDA